MKILMLSTDPRVLEKGSAVASRLLAYGELTEGIEVLVSGGSIGAKQTLELSPKVRVIAVPDILSVLRPLSVVLRGLGSRKQKFSLITAQDPFETGFAGAVLSFLLSLPLEVQIHTDFLNPYFLKHSLLNRLRTVVARFSLSRASIIRTVSERIRRSLLEHYRLSESRVIVLPVMNPPLESVGEPVGLKERYPDFTSFSLAVSRLEPEKNLKALFDSFADVLRIEKTAALVVVGEGRERASLEQHARRLGIEKHVLFQGWQKPGPYFKEADLFVQNSFFEGYSLTLVEAARMGCPIVTTDVGIVGEVITEENASVVPPGDTRAFARAWQTALENPQFMREKAERALEVVKRHTPLSPEAYAEAIVGLWRKACERPV